MRVAFFLALQLLVSGYAIWRGGRPERTIAISMLISVLCGLLLVRPSSHRYLSIEFGVFLVDLALYLAIAFVLMTSNRNWPYLMMALQSVPIAAHVAKLLDPNIISFAYAAMLAFWSYPMLALLVLATRRHELRQRAAIS